MKQFQCFIFSILAVAHNICYSRLRLSARSFSWICVRLSPYDLHNAAACSEEEKMQNGSTNWTKWTEMKINMSQGFHHKSEQTLWLSEDWCVTVPFGNPSCWSSLARVSLFTLYLAALLMMKFKAAMLAFTSPVSWRIAKREIYSGALSRITGTSIAKMEMPAGEMGTHRKRTRLALIDNLRVTLTRHDLPNFASAVNL